LAVTSFTHKSIHLNKNLNKCLNYQPRPFYFKLFPSFLVGYNMSETNNVIVL
jgi:hypothetical protein